jgi:hypothetical protein
MYYGTRAFIVCDQIREIDMPNSNACIRHAEQRVLLKDIDDSEMFTMMTLVFIVN